MILFLETERTDFKGPICQFHSFVAHSKIIGDKNLLFHVNITFNSYWITHQFLSAVCVHSLRAVFSKCSEHEKLFFFTLFFLHELFTFWY